jgi:predicted AAA+ superfamily ATPase
MAELQVARGVVVSWLDEAAAADGIEVVPAWRWLLSGSDR